MFDKNKKILRQSLQQILGLKPDNLNLYTQALRHSTMAESIHDSGFRNSNERLEYLGDAVLNCVVAEFVFLKYPYRGEGYLTQMRSKIVSRDSLNKLSRKMGIDKLVQLEQKTFSHPNGLEIAFGNAMEAIIGAIYLDKGYKSTQKFILKNVIQVHVDMEKLEQTEMNFKSKIYEWAQREGKNVKFEELEIIKNGRHKLRKMAVFVDEQQLAFGVDHIRKKAEQTAAEKACEILKI